MRAGLSRYRLLWLNLTGDAEVIPRDPIAPLLPDRRRYFHNSGQAPFRSSWLAGSFTCGYASTSSFLGQ
jgi:hypothetical protein